MDRNTVKVSQQEDQSQDEGNDVSDRQPVQPVQPAGELYDQDFPQQVAERRRLVDGPFLPQLLPHGPASLLRVRDATSRDDVSWRSASLTRTPIVGEVLATATSCHMQSQ